MMDDKFKICGLCSQLVDEPVMLNASLRSFVIDFLGIANAALPAKVCSECYTACYNAKKFSERVDRAREKLRNAGVGDAMILGKGPDDKRIIEAMAKDMPAAKREATDGPMSPPPVPSWPKKVAEDPLDTSREVKSKPASSKAALKPRRSELDKIGLADTETIFPGPRATRSRGDQPDPPKKAVAPKASAAPKTAAAQSLTPRSTRGRPSEAESLGPTSRLGPRSAKRSTGLSGVSAPSTPAATRPGPASRQSRASTGSAASLKKAQAGPDTIVVRKSKGQYKVDKQYLPGVTVSREEKTLAEQAADLGGVFTYGRKRRGGQLLTPASKRQRGGSINSEDTSVSSFGRLRTPKRRHATDDFVSLEEEDDPIATKGKNDDDDAPLRSRRSAGKAAMPASNNTPTARAPARRMGPASRTTAATAAKTPARKLGPASKTDRRPDRAVSAKKASPPAAKAAAAATESKRASGGGGRGGSKKSSYHYVGDDNSGEAEVQEVDLPQTQQDDSDDDEEEVFPSIGPYQCEICQEITKTKEEFVNHIKTLHIDVVDEEVLRSLESDLKKSKKRKLKQQKTSSGDTRRSGGGKGSSPKTKEDAREAAKAKRASTQAAQAKAMAEARDREKREAVEAPVWLN